MMVLFSIQDCKVAVEYRLGEAVEEEDSILVEAVVVEDSNLVEDTEAEAGSVEWSAGSPQLRLGHRPGGQESESCRCASTLASER